MMAVQKIKMTRLARDHRLLTTPQSSVSLGILHKSTSKMLRAVVIRAYTPFHLSPQAFAQRPMARMLLGPSICKGSLRWYSPDQRREGSTTLNDDKVHHELDGSSDDLAATPEPQTDTSVTPSAAIYPDTEPNLIETRLNLDRLRQSYNDMEEGTKQTRDLEDQVNEFVERLEAEAKELVHDGKPSMETWASYGKAKLQIDEAINLRQEIRDQLRAMDAGTEHRLSAFVWTLSAFGALVHVLYKDDDVQGSSDEISDTFAG